MRRGGDGRGENDPFEKAREFLARLLGYLEGVYSALDWETLPSGGRRAEDTSAHGLPARLSRILYDCGYLQGQILKSQGALSPDLVEFIQGIGFAFEVDAAPVGLFKLPFIDNEIAIQRKTMNVFMEKAWRVYHAALLSAYTLKTLRLEKLPAGPMGELEETVRVLEAKPGERTEPSGADPAAVHAVNNALGGITSYVSLLLGERKQDAELQQRLGLVLEAAKKAGDIIKASSGGSR